MYLYDVRPSGGRLWWEFCFSQIGIFAPPLWVYPHIRYISSIRMIYYDTVYYPLISYNMQHMKRIVRRQAAEKFRSRRTSERMAEEAPEERERGSAQPTYSPRNGL